MRCVFKLSGAIFSGMRKQLIILSIRCHCVNLLTSSFSHKRTRKCIHFLRRVVIIIALLSSTTKNANQLTNINNKKWRAHFIFQRLLFGQFAIIFGMEWTNLLTSWVFSSFLLCFFSVLRQSPFPISLFSYLMNEWKSPVEIN